MNGLAKTSVFVLFAVVGFTALSNCAGCGSDSSRSGQKQKGTGDHPPDRAPIRLLIRATLGDPDGVSKKLKVAAVVLNKLAEMIEKGDVLVRLDEMEAEIEAIMDGERIVVRTDKLTPEQREAIERARKGEATVPIKLVTEDGKEKTVTYKKGQ